MLFDTIDDYLRRKAQALTDWIQWHYDRNCYWVAYRTCQLTLALLLGQLAMSIATASRLQLLQVNWLFWQLLTFCIVCFLFRYTLVLARWSKQHQPQRLRNAHRAESLRCLLLIALPFLFMEEQLYHALATLCGVATLYFSICLPNPPRSSLHQHLAPRPA